MQNSIYYGNSLYILGTTHSSDLPHKENDLSGGADIFVCRVNIDGLTERCRYYGGEFADYTFVQGLVIEPSTGNLVVFVRNGQSPGSSSDFSGLLTKTDSSGKNIWFSVIIPVSWIQTNSDPDIPKYLKLLAVINSIIILA